MIFHNGTVITVERGEPFAEAVAIRAGLIQAVGADDVILGLQGPDTMLVDLRGQTILPGFIEPHSHFIINAVEAGTPMDDIMDALLSFGWTSVTELRGHRSFIDAMLQAEQAGQLRVRVHVFADYNNGSLEDRKTVISQVWYLDHDPILEPGRMLRIPGVKIFADGSGEPGRGCAYYSYPYPESAIALYATYGWDLADICGTPQGDLYLTEAQLTEALQGIQDRGYRAAFHAMGDATVDVILNALEAVLRGEPNATYRHQIHHNSTLRPDQVERYVQMNVIASVRSMFNTCDAAEYPLLLGEDRYEWATNRYQLPLLGIHAIAEADIARVNVSDRPRTMLNPMVKLFGMVTRQQLRKDGSICNPPDWIARYPTSVERTLEMLTIESAYAVSMENHIGSIKPGKYADLVILSGNPLTTEPDDLVQLDVLMTMVNGNGEYCTAGFEALCEGQVSSAANSLPEGFHDASTGTQRRSACLAVGWAADPDNRDLDLEIRIMVDGVEVTQVTADDYRQDLTRVCTGGTCSFSVDLWDVMSRNTEHSVLIQAQDAQTGEWVTLEETPTTLNCTG